MPLAQLLIFTPDAASSAYSFDSIWDQVIKEGKVSCRSVFCFELEQLVCATINSPPRSLEYRGFARFTRFGLIWVADDHETSNGQCLFLLCLFL